MKRHFDTGKTFCFVLLTKWQTAEKCNSMQFDPIPSLNVTQFDRSLQSLTGPLRMSKFIAFWPGRAREYNPALTYFAIWPECLQRESHFTTCELLGKGSTGISYASFTCFSSPHFPTHSQCTARGKRMREWVCVSVSMSHQLGQTRHGKEI